MLFLLVTIIFLTLGALWLAAVLNEHDIHPMRKMAEWMRRPALEVALVALVAVGLIHHGATKGTNGVPGRGIVPVEGSGSGGAIVLVEQVEPATPDTQPSTNLDWLAFGGYEDWFSVAEGNWCFRFGSNLVERVTVFSCGEIAAAPFGASNRISLLGLPLSIVPAANWHLLNPQRSLFWHAATPSNTLLLTWENALANRDTNLPVTVQAELFPDGAAAFRYDFSGIGDISALSNAETQIWRDGVLASNYQLSTTNYQQNCFFAAPAITDTNALDEVQARIAGGNTNAYYCADVVVSKGPAKIRVEPMADETNRGLLGAYEIVALPGETNRLPLLIGPKYTVSAETAFESFELVPPPFVPFADDTGTVERLEFGAAFSATNVTDRLVEVQWPVEYWLKAIDATPEAATYELHVSPDWLGGVLTWHDIADTNAPPMRGAPPMRSGGGYPVSCTCGCLARDNEYLIHSLICLCDHCYADGELVYEAFSQRISLDMKEPQEGGEPHAPGDPGGGTEPIDEPWVSVEFEKDVVIFETPYEVAPGVTNSPSTLTKLTISVYGGENGVTLEPLIGEGKIQLVEASDMLLNSVPPFTRVDWEGYYKGIAENSGEDQTVASVRLKDAEMGHAVGFAFDSVTVVRVKVSSTFDPPSGHMPYRRKFGLLEVVSCEQFPSSPKVSWTYDSGSHHMEGQICYYHCPLVPAERPLHASIGEVVHIPDLTVIAPTGVEATAARVLRYGAHTNEAGYAGMELDLRVLPLDVSFEKLAIEEVPCDRGEKSGYFTNSLFADMWCHSVANGAGKWWKVNNDNSFATDWAEMKASVPRLYRPNNDPEEDPTWDTGWISWEVPFGWTWRREKDGDASNPALYDGVQPLGQFAADVRHVADITPNGTVKVTKLNNWVSRGTNEVIMLNGVVQ